MKALCVNCRKKPAAAHLGGLFCTLRCAGTWALATIDNYRACPYCGQQNATEDWTITNAETNRGECPECRAISQPGEVVAAA